MKSIGRLTNWWSGLSLQEKRAVSMGSIILSIVFIYSLIWSPFMSRLATMRKRLKTESQTLSWMKSAETKIKTMESQGENNGKVVSPVTLMSILQKQINQNALGQSLRELKQTGSDTIEIEFKQVQFDKVVTFLISSMKNYRISIQQFSATASAKSGIVDVTLTLR